MDCKNCSELSSLLSQARAELADLKGIVQGLTEMAEGKTQPIEEIRARLSNQTMCSADIGKAPACEFAEAYHLAQKSPERNDSQKWRWDADSVKLFLRANPTNQRRAKILNDRENRLWVRAQAEGAAAPPQDTQDG
jgi:hypothetical protein